MTGMSDEQISPPSRHRLQPFVYAGYSFQFFTTENLFM